MPGEKNINQLSGDLAAAAKGAKKITRKVMKDLSAEVENFITDNFAAEKFGNNGDKWADTNTKSGDREKRGGILVQTGDLQREVTDIEVVGNELQIGSDLVYAQIHNEGLEGLAFGKHKFTMPKRQYMPIPGEPLPEELEKELDKIIEKNMDKLFEK